MRLKYVVMLPMSFRQYLSFRRKPESIKFYHLGISLFIFMPYAFASVSTGAYIGFEAGVANEILNYNAASAFLVRGNLGYNINKFNGFELGITYNFNVSYPGLNALENFNINATTLDATYILSLPAVVEKLSVFGRIGFAYDWLNSSGICDCTINKVMNGNGFADVLGAGIKYSISPKLFWRLEWIANGLIFPVGINSGRMQANWTNQTFQTGLNYSF
jgi:opacity protein-like surface antigen